MSIIPKESKIIKIAIVGCGRISKNHVKAINYLHKKCEIVALCDNNFKNLSEVTNFCEEFKKEHNLETTKLIKTFSNYDDLLSDIEKRSIEVDLAVICTPSGLHSKQVIAASKLGLHCCTEKPMATTWVDGLNMVKECKKNSVQLFVVKQNRFNNTLQLVKKQIEKGRFGKLSTVTVNVFWQRPQSYYDQAKWRGTWEYDGGALMNQASHYVDLLDWLIGPVKSLCAFTATIGRNIEVEDTATINLKWGNGALGTMAVTMLTYPKNLEGSITILGEKGSVRVGGLAVNNIDWWEFEDDDDDDQLVKEANYQTTNVYGFGHTAYYENMINALLGYKSTICRGDDGLKSLELLIAAYKSSEKKEIINLPLENF